MNEKDCQRIREWAPKFKKRHEQIFKLLAENNDDPQIIMTYYIKLGDEIVDNVKDIFQNEYELCKHNQFDRVYPGPGLKILDVIVNKYPNMMEYVTVINDQGEEIEHDDIADIL